MDTQKKAFILLPLLLLIIIFAFTRLAYSYVQEQPGQTVSVSVEPHASDFEASIVSSTAETVNQNTEITYTITYGSNLYYASGLTIQAEWTLGTAEGSVTPDVEVVDYVISSASDAYSSTPAVIDLINRTITWTISSFPAQTTSQTVSFTLETNENYTGSNEVNFTVYGRTINGSITVSDEVDNTYQYDPTLVTPTPTPTSSPTPTPTPTSSSSTTSSPTSTPTPTPTITPSPTALAFESVSIQSLLSSSARLQVTLNEAAKIKVSYGTRLNNLNTAIQSLSFLKSQQIELSELQPDTTYYVQITATSASGKSAKSDIFTFKTSPVSVVPEPDITTLVVTSNNVILTSPTIFKENKKIIPSIVLPIDSVYEFRFEVKDYKSIKKIEAVLRNKYVLGIAFPEKAEASTEKTFLTQVSPGVFEGRLKTPIDPGRYEIVVRVFDTQGNIAEKKVADVKIVKNLTVLREGSTTPVEGARILISYFDFNANDFIPLSPTAYSVKNPSYTDAKGEDNIVLPAEKYKASVSAIGYAAKEVEFKISDKTGDDYPTIYLKHEFGVTSFAAYLYNSFIDLMNLTKLYLITIGSSNRFFEFNATLSLLITLIIIFFGLSIHTKIPLNQLHSYIFNLFRKRSKKFVSKNIFGKVLNYENGLPESGVTIYLIDGVKDDIIYQAKTNKLGEFYFRKPELENYKFLIMKEGFEDLPEEFSKEKVENTNNFAFNIKGKVKKGSFKGLLRESMELLFALLIPGLIIICLVVEFALGYSFGFLKVLPFVIISIINAFLWAKFYRPAFKNL